MHRLIILHKSNSFIKGIKKGGSKKFNFQIIFFFFDSEASNQRQMNWAIRFEAKAQWKMLCISTLLLYYFISLRYSLSGKYLSRNILFSDSPIVLDSVLMNIINLTISPKALFLFIVDCTYHVPFLMKTYHYHMEG